MLDRTDRLPRRIDELRARRRVDHVAAAKAIHHSGKFARYSFTKLRVAVVYVDGGGGRLLPHFFLNHMAAHHVVLGDELAKLIEHAQHAGNPGAVFVLAFRRAVNLPWHLLLEFSFTDRTEQHLAERSPSALVEFERGVEEHHAPFS